MEERIEVHHTNELLAAATKAMAFGRHIPVWLFEGGMGAGKTTFIKALAEVLGVSDAVHSPTFSLVNEYETGTGKPLYHFDFYRIKNEEEAMDIGVEEYLDSGNYCFIEWPSMIENLLPLHYLYVRIDVEEDGKRVIYLKDY